MNDTMVFSKTILILVENIIIFEKIYKSGFYQFFLDFR